MQHPRHAICNSKAIESKENSVRFLTLIFAVALALSAGCSKGPEPRAATPPQGADASAGSSTSTPAYMGQSSSQEQKDGANPVQGQVDPKEGAQHKDFQQRGDSAGPQQSK